MLVSGYLYVYVSNIYAKCANKSSPTVLLAQLLHGAAPRNISYLMSLLCISGCFGHNLREHFISWLLAGVKPV